MKKNKQKKGTGKLIFNSVIYFTISLLLFSVILGGFAISRIVAESPEVDIEKINSYEPTKILDNQGNFVAYLGGELRENITYNDLPQVVVDAFLAVEDSRYETHNGFDIPRFMKSFFVNVARGGIKQGGSTITMQLVDNSYFNTDASQQSVVQRLKQKISEITMGVTLESKTSKEEIITAYLNKINFGDRVRGIGKASKYYFGKPISEVNLSEAAYLAGMINAPNLYNPYQGKIKFKNGKVHDYYANAVSRRNMALSLMKLHGYITQKEYDLAVNTDLSFQLAGGEEETNNNYLAYTDVVEQEVRELTGKNPHTVSMTIYTALDKPTQDLSNEISERKHVNFTQEDNLQIGAVVLDNVNNELVAINPGFGNYVGDARRNYGYSEKNQIGSTAKPLFSYAPAFEYLGYSTAHTFDVKPVKYRGTDFTVNNVYSLSGKQQFETILAYSLNTTSLETFYRVWDTIGSAGYEDLKNKLGLGFAGEVTDQFALGAGDLKLSPFDLAAAYSVFPNKGVYTKPTTIRKIIIHNTGEEIVPKAREHVQVYSPETAYLMGTLLERNVSGGYANGLGIIGDSFPTYAKSGTSDWGTAGAQYGIPNSSAKDLWAAAYSGNTTVVTWVGYDPHNYGANSYFNSSKIGMLMPQNMAKRLLSFATRERENREIVRPENVVSERHVRGSYPYMSVPDYVKGDKVVSGLINKKFLSKFEQYKSKVEISTNGFEVKEKEAGKTLSYKFKKFVGAEDDIYGKVSYRISIVDATGNKLIEETYQTPEGVIDVSHLPNGVYHIEGNYAFENADSPVEALSYEYRHELKQSDSSHSNDDSPNH